MTSNVVLVRHAPVAACYHGICYGRSDVPLGPEGLEQSDRIAEILSCLPIRHLVTSPAARAHALAQRIALRTGREMIVEPALLERDFGAWEMRSWDSIHEEVGEALDGLIHEPESYRPPGGESTGELRDRAISWYVRRPKGGLVLVVAHGGPIAAIRGTLAGKEPVEWMEFIPQPGTWVEVKGEIALAACGSKGSGTA
jgi:broad specificity phosphatase PhoE